MEKTELAGIVQTYRTMVRTMNDLNLQKEQDELSHYLGGRSMQGKLPEWVEETYAQRLFRHLLFRYNRVNAIHKTICRGGPGHLVHGRRSV